jgi:hypothetical protein
MSRPETKTSPLSIAVAWTLVTVPLAWGVYQSVVKSLPLFHISTAAEPPATSVRK